MNKIFRLIGLVAFACCASCRMNPLPDASAMPFSVSTDTFEEYSIADELNTTGMEILDIALSPDCKTFTIDIDVSPDLHGALREDSGAVTFGVRETVQNLIDQRDSKWQPHIANVDDVLDEEISTEHFNLLMLVDLTLPQPLIDYQQEAVDRIVDIYGSQKVYVSFMYNNAISEILPATNYVMDNYFIHQADTEKYLYRSIVAARDSMRHGGGKFPVTKNQSLVVFSDGKVYDDHDVPLDPNHYQYKEELDKLYPELVRDTMSIYYVNVSGIESDNVESASTLRRMCRNYDGLYLESFDWTRLEADIKRAFNLKYCDYRITLTNPDGKLYRGTPHTIYLEVKDLQGNVLATDSYPYTVGTMYQPIIVNDNSTKVLIRGGLFMLCMLSLAFFIFQVLIPYISYRLFLKRNVLIYTGKNMSTNGFHVNDVCYLCKDHFYVGDTIVAKCQHTVHKSCWDENEYKCPEFGRKCKTGSHYYNVHHVWDKRNASPYMKWVMTACIAALLAWAFSLVNIGKYDLAFGLGFFYVLLFGSLSLTRRSHFQHVAIILGLSLVAGFGCWGVFTLLFSLASFLNITYLVPLIDMISWGLCFALILFLLSSFSQKKRNSHIYAIALGVCVLVMMVWNIILVGLSVDYRLLMLLSLLTGAVVIAFTIFYINPAQGHYYLSLSGDTKPIDVALYKWFSTAPTGSITIGKSVDCDLQINWNINGGISPVHAEIRMRRGVLYLYALEDGVMVKGKSWPVGKGLRLYHGSSFRIAQTFFVFKSFL